MVIATTVASVTASPFTNTSPVLTPQDLMASASRSVLFPAPVLAKPPSTQATGWRYDSDPYEGLRCASVPYPKGR